MPSLGGWEFVILIGILVLLFGAKRLPDMARSIGQSARVFKGEMKGMRSDDDARGRRRHRPARPALPPSAPPAAHPHRSRAQVAAPADDTQRHPAGAGQHRASSPSAVAKFSLRRGIAGPKSPDGTMTLVEHLYELRNRLPSR